MLNIYIVSDRYLYNKMGKFINALIDAFRLSQNFQKKLIDLTCI